METDYHITRTYSEFVSFLRFLVAQGATKIFIAEQYGINSGYLSMILKDPDYYPSERVARACHIVKAKPARRVILHKGSDMEQKAREVIELTNGEYTVARVVDTVCLKPGQHMECPTCSQELVLPGALDVND